MFSTVEEIASSGWVSLCLGVVPRPTALLTMTNNLNVQARRQLKEHIDEIVEESYPHLDRHG
jgi:hypothetical protein